VGLRFRETLLFINVQISGAAYIVAVNSLIVHRGIVC
jgi:hypothetical protein